MELLLRKFPLFVFTAFIQSDTILEVLHFDEGRLLQVSAALVLLF